MRGIMSEVVSLLKTHCAAQSPRVRLACAFAPCGSPTRTHAQLRAPRRSRARAGAPTDSPRACRAPRSFTFVIAPFCLQQAVSFATFQQRAQSLAPCPSSALTDHPSGYSTP